MFGKKKIYGCCLCFITPVEFLTFVPLMYMGEYLADHYSLISSWHFGCPELVVVWKVCLLSIYIYMSRPERPLYIKTSQGEVGRQRELCFKKECCLPTDRYLYDAQIRWWLQTQEIPGLGTWKQIKDCMYVCVCHQIKGRGRQPRGGELLWSCREKVCGLFSPCK